MERSITGSSDLIAAIEELEKQKAEQENELQEKYREVLVSLKPRNIIANTIRDVQVSTPLKGSLLKLALGLGAGYVSKRMMIKQPAGTLSKVLGTALQYGIASLFAAGQPGENDQENLISKAGHFFKKILKKKKETTKSPHLEADTNL